MDFQRRFLTYYDILGIHKDAQTDEIRKAYRKRVLETHPDKLDVSANDEEKQAAEREFQKVHEAFQTLGDAHKRRRYDALLLTKTDPALISEYSAKRTADRHEWARQQEEMSQRRIDAFRIQMQIERVQQEEKRRLEKEMKRKAEEERLKQEAEREARLLAETLRDMVNANPDFAARREAILKKKAESERLEKEKTMSKNTPPITPSTSSPTASVFNYYL